MGLAEFYRNTTSWPSQENELGNVAARICNVCEVSFAAIITQPAPGVFFDSAGAGEKIGIAFSEKKGLAAQLPSEQFTEASLKEFLKAYAKAKPASPVGEAPELEEISVTREHGPLFVVPSVHFITAARITAEVLSGPSVRDQRARKEVAWLILGSDKRLEPAQQIVVFAVIERLSELAELAHFGGVISLRSQFLSIASHELKTPLTSIYGILQLQERMLRLKKDEPSEVQLERQHSFLKMVIRQVERLNELIDGLLDVSRIQNGRFMVEPSETDVAANVRDSVSGRLNMIAQEAGVSLNVDAPATLMAWVDPVRFEEVVTNLVMNAIRFSPEGGLVSVRLREDGGAFRMSVRDQGPSVPIEDRERIFQPFERAQRTSRLGGLGLGLFISRQIAQLHGGNVSLVESLPGKGNVFEAHFPMREVGLISA